MIVTDVWNPRDLNNNSDFKNILEHGVYANIEFPIFQPCDHKIPRYSWMNTNDANTNSNEIGTLSKSFEDVLCEEVTHLSEQEMIYFNSWWHVGLYTKSWIHFLEGSGSEKFI